MEGMKDDEAREVLRKIILEENGLEEDSETRAVKVGPTHFELLLRDLDKIGIPPEVVLDRKQTVETRATERTRKDLDQLIAPHYDPHYDLTTLVALRMAGEILVGEGYGFVVPALKERFHLENSEFYEPHYAHDTKRLASGEHTKSFESVLNRLINTQEKLLLAKESATKAYHARMSFYDQFTKQARTLKNLKRVGLAVAASVGIGLTINHLIIEDPHEIYSRFLQSLEPEARAFYVNAEQRQFEKYLETGNKKYLETLGTFKAAEEEWGQDP